MGAGQHRYTGFSIMGDFMRLQIMLLMLLFLTGCGTTSVTEYQAPDGTTIKTTKCSADSKECFQTASKSCPNSGSYRVVSSESHAGGIFADILPGPVTWYGMTYVCGPSDGKMPDFKWQGQQYTPPAAPTTIINKSRPTTTNCNTYGNNTTCNSY
jgi:hypothetical protein